MEKVRISIDGKEIEVEKGITIFEAARKNGIEIPHLCYCENISISGACRLCLVEVEGENNLTASCAYPIGKEVRVHTNTERVIKARSLILELILSDHPIDCLTCDSAGECKLQDYAYEYGISKSRFIGETHQYEIENANPFIVRDYNKCILCARCVKVCNELQACDVQDFSYRGFKTKVSTGFALPMQEANCVFCGNCVEFCPVGALREKQAERKGRPWQLRQVKTICPYCGCGCGLILHIKNNRIVKISGDRDNPVNTGWLCVKGRFGYEFVHSPERLTKPLIKNSKLKMQNAKFTEVTWNEVLDFVAKKFREIKEKYGPDAIAGLSSAKCTNEENYLFQKFMRAVIGTNNVDHCARLCHASTLVGLVKSFGSGAMTNTIAEIKDADCILITGSNTSEAHPIVALQVKIAKRKNKAKVIVADPRRIEMIEFADLWLQQKPGTDVALFNGIMNVIISEKLYDERFVNERTEGFTELKEHLRKYTPEYVQEITGVASGDIVSAARMYAQAEKASIIYSMGITQHTTGTDNVLVLADLAMLTGNVGKESSGVNPLRGQNNVQGACDLGALPGFLPGYQRVDNSEVREKFEKSYQAKLPENVGLTVVEIFNAILEGKIKALYIMGENVMLSDPNINHVREALEKLDFLVVQDMFLTETAKYADVILSSCSFAEKDGTFTNTERRVQRLRKAIDPLGESKPDWQIITELARKMGYPMPNYLGPDDIMDEIASLTPIYAGINYQRIDAEGMHQNGAYQGLHWPCPNTSHPGTKILHQGKFTRGLGKFHPVEYKPPAEETDENYPLILTTGRILYQYHTGTMTRRVEGLNQLAPSAFVELNPEEAKKYRLKEKDSVKVTSRRGEIIVKVRITERIAPGVLFIPFHFAEAAVNILTIDALDPQAKIPEFKVCAVRIEPVYPVK